ncbi:MAG: NAD(P)H-hydrate dehydratase [Elusimicrobiales bacterium]
MIKRYIDRKKAIKFLPQRPENLHKHLFGRVLIIGGSTAMSGAVSFTALSALKCGCGLVYVICPSSIKNTVSVLVPEAIVFGCLSEYFFSSKDISVFANVVEKTRPDLIVFGPGMGTEPETSFFLTEAMNMISTPVLIDADGLNILSSSKKYHLIKNKPSIITPHTGEAVRFFDIKDPDKLSLKLSMELGSVAVVKDYITRVSDGQIIYILKKPNSALSKAGSGDVLCGIIAGLWAQRGKRDGFSIKTAFESSVCGVFIHSLSAQISRDELTSYSVNARDLISAIPKAFFELVYERKRYNRSDKE